MARAAADANNRDGRLRVAAALRGDVGGNRLAGGHAGTVEWFGGVDEEREGEEARDGGELGVLLPVGSGLAPG